MANSLGNNIRRINEAEKTTIARVIKPTGYKYSGSGSCETRDDGKLVYHISFDIGSAATVGTALGCKLRKALGADEVYFMGKKL